MSGKALKRNSYWLRERNKKQTDVEKYTFNNYVQFIAQVNIKLDLKIVVLLKKLLKKPDRRKILKMPLNTQKIAKNFLIQVCLKKSNPNVLKNNC